MYIPEANRETRPEVLHGMIREYSFGTLVSADGGELVASHLPFLLDAEAGPHGRLLGHMARANPQWESFREEAEVMVIFQGPHAYVSPSWYQAPMSVPTWNYVAVHAYGVPRLIRNADGVRGVLEATVQTYEAGLPQPWSVDQLPAEFVDKMSQAIVGFEIPLTRLEGKRKLSQNRSEADRRGVIGALRQGDDESGRAVAELMAGLCDEHA